MFFYISAENRVPKNHPLRPVKAMVEECLKALNEKFNKMYSLTGATPQSTSSAGSLFHSQLVSTH
jgi:hypothetical protein